MLGNIVSRAAARYCSMATIPQNTSASADKFKVKLAVKNYSPEEVRVKVNNGYLVIEGKHEEDGPQGKTTREFTKWFRIPEDVDAASLEHDMASDGTLSLTANKKVLPQEPMAYSQMAMQNMLQSAMPATMASVTGTGPTATPPPMVPSQNFPQQQSLEAEMMGRTQDSLQYLVGSPTADPMVQYSEMPSPLATQADLMADQYDQLQPQLYQQQQQPPQQQQQQQPQPGSY